MQTLEPELFATYETIELTFQDEQDEHGGGRVVFDTATFTSLRYAAAVITHEGYRVYEGEDCTHIEEEGGAVTGIELGGTDQMYQLTELGDKLVEGIHAMAKV